MNDQTNWWDDNRITPTNFDKSMDEDTHLDQPINEETIKLNMTQMLWILMLSPPQSMQWAIKNEVNTLEKDFASTASNLDMFLETVPARNPTRIWVRMTNALLLHKMTIAHSPQATTTHSEMCLTQSRKLDHMRSTRWSMPSLLKNKMKCLQWQKQMMKRKDQRKRILFKESWVDDSLSYLEYSLHLFYCIQSNR